MPPLRRLTALLLDLLLVQLLLGGAGAEHVRGMAMAGHAEHAVHVATAVHVPGCPDCDVPAGGSPCDAPMAPGVCSTMPSCAVAMPTSLPSPPFLVATSPGVDAVSDATPVGPVAAPELPPPRA